MDLGRKGQRSVCGEIKYGAAVLCSLNPETVPAGDLGAITFVRAL